MTDGLSTEAALRALLGGRHVSAGVLEVALADVELLRAERDRYHELLSEGLEPIPDGLTEAEWVADWHARIKAALS